MTDEVRACPHGDLPCSCTDGTRPWLRDEGAWLCGRGHTTRQPKCPACHDVSHARAQAATPAVVIDAAMFTEIVAALATLCYLTHREFCATCGEWDCEQHGYHDLVARVIAAREGK